MTSGGSRLRAVVMRSFAVARGAPSLIVAALLCLAPAPTRAEVASERVRESVDEILADPRFQRARPDGSFEVPDEVPDVPFDLPDFSPRSFEPSEASGVSEALLWVLAAVFGVALIAVVAREGARFARRRAVKKKKKRALARGDGLDLATAAAERLPASLAEALALARQGRFEEAIHVLLRGALGYLHALSDFSLEPALTSREVLVRAPLARDTRGAFEDLVMTVEVSLFGGMPVDAEDFERCRRSFEVMHRHLGGELATTEDAGGDSGRA